MFHGYDSMDFVYLFIYSSFQALFGFTQLRNKTQRMLTFFGLDSLKTVKMINLTEVLFHWFLCKVICRLHFVNQIIAMNDLPDNDVTDPDACSRFQCHLMNSYWPSPDRRKINGHSRMYFLLMIIHNTDRTILWFGCLFHSVWFNFKIMPNMVGSSPIRNQVLNPT